MKNFEGMKWGELTTSEKEELLKNANCIDGETGNNVEDGECIVDLTEEYSVGGNIIDDEIIIDDNAIIYNPCK